VSGLGPYRQECKEGGLVRGEIRVESTVDWRNAFAPAQRPS
jgi:hypothetical protein